MNEIVQIDFLDIDDYDEYKELINAVINRCFEEEKLINTKLYISITLTTPENIRNINKEYRNTDKETDVLSFPMFEQEEIKEIINSKQHLVEDVLGDIVISVKKVQEQAIEYGHSFKRELSYMLVHGFYHLMGYDHIKEEDKKEMRPKEEKILQDLNIIRN